MDMQQIHGLLAGLVEGLGQQEADRRIVHQQRSIIQTLGRQTTPCDGLNTASVRNWIREVTLAYNQVGAPGIIEVASQTVTGPLRFEFERFVSNHRQAHNVARRDVPWDAIRTHISAQFLNVDEASALRDEVDQLKQSAYEPDAQYSRRFREVADAAYPEPIRNADQERILVRSFAKGLSSNAMARKLVEDINPANLNAAINSISQMSERHDAYSRLGRREEPMEVNAVVTATHPPTPAAGRSVPRSLDSLCNTIDKLCTKVAKLETSGRSEKRNTHNRRTDRPANQENSRGPAWNTQGRPRCFVCNNYGHFARECRQSGTNQQGNY